MRVGFSPQGWRDWQKLPKNIQKRLQQKLLWYSRDPLKYAAKLTGPDIGQYRFRIGDYRIIFDMVEDNLVVLAVGHRKDIYR